MARPGLLEKRRQEFERHLIRSLDILSYCHLLYMYYMDISLLRLILRSIIQLNYLTPKPFPIPQASRTKIVYFAILGANAYCLMVHLFASLPVSREANAGYLHGGLTIEFTGQKAPSSRLQLLFSDIVVALFQMIMLAISTNLQNSSIGTNLVTPIPASLSAAAALATGAAETAQTDQHGNMRQTIDDEERSQTHTNIVPSAPSVDEIQPAQTGDADGFSGEVVAVELHLSDIIGRTNVMRRRPVITSV
ncbi:hypothetical protein V1512DRAFT_131710 [Lipomyces arxii]|uniref:uncharacterized protein n=1 Tax=Lipomyces arxii TaxID=56418 RepID=UPI0034CEC811